MINLYKEFTPNTASAVHYLFEDVNDYINKIIPYLVVSYDIENYRINRNVLMIKFDNYINAKNYDDITYICDNFDENGYQRFYFVENCYQQSGYAFYNLSIDYWASYIYRARIDNIHVKRCNRNIATGVYRDDFITKTNSNEWLPISGTTIGSDNKRFDINKASIVFCMSYNVVSTNTGSIDTTQLFAINLKDLKENYCCYAESGEPRNANDQLELSQTTNAVDYAIAVVGGIYGVSAWGPIKNTNDAKVTQAWIVDNTLLLTTDNLVEGIKTRNLYDGRTLSNTLVNAVIPSNLSRYFSLNLDKNYNYYVGTQGKGLKIKKLSDSTTQVQYNVIVSQSDLKVIVKQGDNQMDITDAFAVQLTLNAGEITGIRAMISTIQQSYQEVARFMTLKNNKDATTLDYAGLLVDYAGGFQNKFVGTLIGSGDGYLNFRNLLSSGFSSNYYENINFPIYNPYALTKCQSIENEDEIVARQGITFDCYISDLSYIFNYNLLTVTNNTFLQCDCNVTNTILDACNLIKTKLASGIFIEKIERE